MRTFLMTASLAATLVVGPAGLALAATDSGCWTVQNVAAGDSLNVRADPDHRSSIVDRLVPNAHGVITARGRCIPTSEPWAKRWCPIAHHSGNYPTTRGWVKARFIRGAGCP